MKLKDKFKAIIDENGFTARFIGNYDDVNEGFDITPDIGYLIQVKMTMLDGLDEREAFVRIDKFVMNTTDITLTHSKILAGSIVQDRKGNVDWNFYHLILKNWRLF